MKTAVSIPDRLFRTVDQLAKHQKTTRSAIYVTALREYVARRDADALRRWAELCEREAETPEWKAWTKLGEDKLRSVEWTD